MNKCRYVDCMCDAYPRLCQSCVRHRDLCSSCKNFRFLYCAEETDAMQLRYQAICYYPFQHEIALSLTRRITAEPRGISRDMTLDCLSRGNRDLWQQYQPLLAQWRASGYIREGGNERLYVTEKIPSRWGKRLKEGTEAPGRIWTWIKQTWQQPNCG